MVFPNVLLNYDYTLECIFKGAVTVFGPMGLVEKAVNTLRVIFHLFLIGQLRADI